MKNVKIELIDENKIKVVLSCLDILNLDDDITELFGETTNHALLTAILNEAFLKFGFMALSGRIMVESVPSPSEGYIVIITKLGDENDEKERASVIYVFNDYYSLKTGILEIEKVFHGSSTLYALDGRYYLVMNSVLEENFSKTQIMLTEFAEKTENTVMLEAVLCEYGKLLFKKNAVNMLKSHIND